MKKENIPNLLTFSRGIFILLITILFFFQPPFFAFWSLFLFLLASLTDFFDGYLSRKWKCVSVIGTVFDSTFDKLLILSLFFLLFPFFPQFSFLFLFLFWREVLVDTIKNFLLSKSCPVSSVYSGKLKMVFQIIFIVFCLLSLEIPLCIYGAWIFGILSVISAFVSAIVYIKKFLTFLK